MLAEIHRSKSSFCTFTAPEFHQYDIILPSLEKINIRTIAEAKRNRAKRIGDADYQSRKQAGEKVKQADCEVDYKKINKTDLVFRIMTYDHIPLNATRKKNPKSAARGLYQFMPSTYRGNGGKNIWDGREQIKIAHKMYKLGQQKQWVCK